jgi:predicted HTH domain antitoxin
MKAKALRLPDNLLDAVKFAGKKEKLDEPTTIRKFLRLGAEKYVGDNYVRGDVSLREAADVLDITVRETLELFWDMGIAGNIDADKALKAIFFVEKKSTKK